MNFCHGEHRGRLRLHLGKPGSWLPKCQLPKRQLLASYAISLLLHASVAAAGWWTWSLPSLFNASVRQGHGGVHLVAQAASAESPASAPNAEPLASARLERPPDSARAPSSMAQTGRPRLSPADVGLGPQDRRPQEAWTEASLEPTELVTDSTQVQTAPAVDARPAARQAEPTLAQTAKADHPLAAASVRASLASTQMRASGAEAVEVLQPSFGPPPVYPSDALARRITGRVIVRLFVAPDGRVLASELVTTSGTASLDQAALSAVQKWRFPALPKGQTPFDRVALHAVRFRLDN